MRSSLLFLALSISSFGQLSPAGTYLGRLGSNDIAVGVPRRDSVAFYHFDRTNRRLEFASGSLGADGRATLAASTGRVVTLIVSANTVSGTLAGAPFTATLESPYGPFASKAFGYTGTAADPTNGNIGVIVLGIYASGKVVLISQNAIQGAQGGIGTITQDGIVAVTMTTGFSWNLLFTPSDGVASGLITSPGVASLQFVLVQGQRAPLVNIATRGTVGGSNILTAGFVCTTSAKTLLIRAGGPTLAALGVSSAQSDPVLTLYSGSTVIATNDNWGTAPNAADIPAASLQAGAFGLQTGSRDAVLLVTLDPGAYTAQVTGNGPAGDALVEVYEIK